MRDFDDFFGQKLNEESSFPHRAKMWKQVSKRLDAFDAGTVQGSGSKLLLWKAVAAAALVAAGAMYLKYHKAQEKALALQKEIAALTAPTEKSSVALSRPDEPSWPRPASPQSAQLVQTGKGGMAPKAEAAPLFSSHLPKNGLKSGQLASLEPAHAPLAAVAERQEAAYSEAPEAAGNGDAAPFVGIGAQVDSLSGTVLSLSASPLATVADSAETKQSVAAQNEEEAPFAAPQQPLTKPTKNGGGRYRLGIHGTLGFIQPKQPGVSSIKGHGLSAEVRVLPSLWVLAGVDWVHHEVSTTAFFPKFHAKRDSLPKPPPSGGPNPGPKPPPKLALVESSPRDQHFQLGLRYELPVEIIGLRPCVRLAHQWVRRSPSTVTFKFEEKDPAPNPPGPPKPIYVAEKFYAKWIDNQWRAGFGVEKDIPNWTFSLWADYSKNLSEPTANFDALYLRAGAQYRF